MGNYIGRRENLSSNDSNHHKTLLQWNAGDADTADHRGKEQERNQRESALSASSAFH
jgi:hypothetical protein